MATVTTRPIGDGADDGVVDPEALGRGRRSKRYEELVEQVLEPSARPRATRSVSSGGLYVLGTERHESRRIDNQLRGRSGRQGDPGESRFYLSLEDDLMRWFATGAIEWVMGKGWDDEVPIEAKMVTRAIEKAQNTVEARNGEIRKNVLKYDEVPNEQRKVIYRRRDQVLDGVDLREETIEALASVVDDLLATHCGADYSEEWDLEALVADTATYWPDHARGRPSSAGAATSDELYDLLMADAMSHYEAREDEFGAENMRQIERQVMLRVIDARWREHLKEMDHLRDGINLRALGQKDPLSEWQRECYDMFGQLMDTIDQEYVQYVMRVQVTEQPAAPDAGSPSGSTTRRPAGPVRSRRGPPGGAGRRRQPLQLREAAGARPARHRAEADQPQARQAAGGEDRVGEDPAQRTVSVRQWQEVQAVPRGQLSDARAGLHSTAPGRAARRAWRRPAATCGSTSSMARRPQLETELGRPDLWDDAEAAQALQREFAELGDDLELFESHGGPPGRRRHAGRAGPRGGRRVPRVRDRRRAGVARVRVRRAWRLRALFTGEYDDLDAIVEINSGAGGVDAQDWAEMLLRMYLRWAERRGLRRGARQRQRGHRGRHQLGGVHHEGPQRLRLAAQRARGAPAGADLAVRQQRPPPDQLRLGEGDPALRRRRRGRDRRQGAAHRRVPLLGRRWPARERDRLGGAHHPPAHRHRHVAARTSGPSTRTRTGP